MLDRLPDTREQPEPRTPDQKRFALQEMRVGIDQVGGTEDLQVADEMADVLWVLMCLANQTGVDLTTALEKNFEKKNVRDAERHKGNEKLS